MTKLLDEAIEKVRELLEVDQDKAAELRLALLAKRSEPVRHRDLVSEPV